MENTYRRAGDLCILHKRVVRSKRAKDTTTTTLEIVSKLPVSPTSKQNCRLNAAKNNNG